MNKNIVIVLAGGALMAILVAVLVSAVLGGGKKQKRQQVVQAAPQIEILVAKKNLGVGQKLTNENMEWKKWPQKGTFPGTVTRKKDQKPTEALEGRLKRSLVQGEPVTRNAVLEAEGNYIAASLKPGMRAVAMKVDAEATAGGFVGPGDHVDIMLTYRATVKPDADDKAIKALQEKVIDQNLNKVATETILQNIKVLAVDQQAVRSEEKVKVGKTVTLEVTPRQAEILAMAEKAGDLSLSLRGVGDDVTVVFKEPVVTDERLTSVYDEILVELEKAQGGSKAPVNSVRIYQGEAAESIAVP